MKLHERLEQNVIMDYYTPNIKAEVIFDTILTPVIGTVLTVIGQNNKETGINGEMKLLAKEFPMLKQDEEKEKSDYRNCNADYLMCDENSVYFVELKTTQESFNPNQMNNYFVYLAGCENKKFADVSGAAFIDLLNQVSKTGYSRNSKKPWGRKEKDDLKRLFEAIIQFPKYVKSNREISLEKNWEKENNHADRAIIYLKEEKAVSSKKYLLTAGQMLDHMDGSDWWNYEKIRLLYLTPEKLSDKQISDYQQKDIILVTFKQIIEQAYAIGKEMEKSDLKGYWEWVMRILVQCGLYDGN